MVQIHSPRPIFSSTYTRFPVFRLQHRIASCPKTTSASPRVAKISVVTPTGVRLIFTDPTGHDVAVVGDLTDINIHVQVHSYLLNDPKMAAIIHKLEQSKKIYYIRILHGSD